MLNFLLYNTSWSVHCSAFTTFAVPPSASLSRLLALSDLPVRATSFFIRRFAALRKRELNKFRLLSSQSFRDSEKYSIPTNLWGHSPILHHIIFKNMIIFNWCIFALIVALTWCALKHAINQTWTMSTLSYYIFKFSTPVEPVWACCF